MLTPIPLGLVLLHKPDGEPYHVSNSLRGIKRAHDIGATAIDIDVNLTRDGHVVGTHWSRPMRLDHFHDPRGELDIDRHVSSMTLAQVGRLRAYPGAYRIRPARDLMAFAAPIDITLCFEAKVDKRLANPAVWEVVRRQAEATGAQVLIMATPRLGGIKRLRAAKAAGLPTMLLTRGPVYPWQWRHLDYVKGPRRWTDPGRPRRVKRLGTGARDATRYGASCVPGTVKAVRTAVLGRLA